MSRVLPKLFNTDMVRAVLDGRKTVTRRVVKPQMDACPSCMHMNVDYIYDKNAQNVYCARCGDPFEPEIKPPYQPGDILYVRETWGKIGDIPHWQEYFRSNSHPVNPEEYIYKADNVKVSGILPEIKWRPSIHMPKEVARIWLNVTDVRVEKLQAITNEQILKEGISQETVDHYMAQFPEDTEEWVHAAHWLPFSDLWNSTVKKNFDLYSWDANPWVWVIEFERKGQIPRLLIKLSVV